MTHGYRQCHTIRGEAKALFASFDDAMHCCASVLSTKRMHPYRCDPCGGWHVGQNQPIGVRHAR